MKIQFGYTPGQTLTAERFTETGTTSLQTASGVTGSGTVYVATFSGTVAAGRYRIAFELAGTEVGYEYYTVVSGYDAAVPILPDSELAVTSGGGAFASAESIVDEIENRGITTVVVQSGVTSATTLELIQGDTYDGVGKPLLSFTVAKNYTSGWAATLTIRDELDVVISTTVGTIASATSITFSLTAPTGLAMIGCPGSWRGKFDVQLSKTTSRETITRGDCYVYEDQTRG